MNKLDPIPQKSQSDLRVESGASMESYDDESGAESDSDHEADEEVVVAVEMVTNPAATEPEAAEDPAKDEAKPKKAPAALRKPRKKLLPILLTLR